MSDLRELDEEIARMRGWEFVPEPAGPHAAPAHWRPGSVSRDAPLTADLRWFHSVRMVTDPDPPPFSSSWALAGPLLVELAEAGAWDGNVLMDCIANAENPCHVIAASWWVWRRGRA